MYTVNKMRLTNDGEWEYVKEKSIAPPSDKTTTTADLDDLWEGMDNNELIDLDPPGPGLTIPLVNGNAAAIKKLSNDDAEENLGMKVQSDGCNKRRLSTLKGKVEERSGPQVSTEVNCRRGRCGRATPNNCERA